MKLPVIVLAAVAITISAPTSSNARATQPDLPTANPQTRSETSHHDAELCGVDTLRGKYVFAARGFNIVAGVAQPKAIVEVVEFNGDGTLSVPAATRSVNGVIGRSVAGIGTYTVENDCAGTILFEGPAFDIFTSPGAEAIWMIQTNPDSVFQGTATRTSPARGGS
jgi:hypothetical protein